MKVNDAMWFHLEASKRMLAGVGHVGNDVEAGWRGPRAHDYEYVLALGHVTLPDRFDCAPCCDGRTASDAHLHARQPRTPPLFFFW